TSPCKRIILIFTAPSQIRASYVPAISCPMKKINMIIYRKSQEICIMIFTPPVLKLIVESLSLLVLELNYHFNSFGYRLPGSKEGQFFNNLNITRPSEARPRYVKIV